jgi:hypothetical protein
MAYYPYTKANELMSDFMKNHIAEREEYINYYLTQLISKMQKPLEWMIDEMMECDKTTFDAKRDYNYTTVSNEMWKNKPKHNDVTLDIIAHYRMYSDYKKGE